jgi:hypothetical protein
MTSRLILILATIGVVSAAFLSGLGTPPPAQANDGRLVLAFFYAWFDNHTWNSGRVSDLPATLYNSDDRGAMARQIDQAQSAGIDAFILNWWGKGNRTEKNLKALLDIAAQKGFRMAVDFDINSPVMSGVGSYADNLRHLHAVHAAHPAYLRYQGRPVVFFYNVSRLPVATWQSLRDQADPGRNALWIAEGTDLKYLSVFDGHHLYSITWPNRISPSQTLATWGDRVRKYDREHGTAKIWVATVMPGYDDRKARPGSGFSRSRDGGEYYRQGWQAAIASKPHWVIVNSFNEWPEGSYIEPSRAYGSQYLDLTREWAAQFKGTNVTVNAGPLSAPTVTAVPPTPLPPTPTPRPPAYVIEDPRIPGKGQIGPRCGYVLTDDGAVYLWEAYCYSDDMSGETTLIID